MSSILRETPVPVNEVNPVLPAELGRIVAHCLEKDPRDRYHSAVDVRNELRGLRREIESGVSRAAGPVSGASTTEASGSHALTGVGRGRGLWLGLAAAVVIVAGLVMLFGRGDNTSDPVVTHRTTPVSRTSEARSVDPNSIAVMAFVNMSPEPEQEYFSDGIAEELLNLLATVPGLKVISRSSAFSYKGSAWPTS